MDKIQAPFTDEQVGNLNNFQATTKNHPFTCSGEHCDVSEMKKSGGVLIATNEGWVCPCGKYKQDWAWKFMAD